MCTVEEETCLICAQFFFPVPIGFDFIIMASYNICVFSD